MNAYRLVRQLAPEFVRMRQINIVKAAVSLGQRLPGVSRGPNAVLHGSELLQSLERDHIVRLLGATTNVYDTYTSIRDNCDKNSFVLTLGGDHSVGVATVAARMHHHPNMGVIWVDAHADINTRSTSLTGNTHGMSVAKLLGLDDDDWMSMQTPTLHHRNLVYVGLRDLDAAEVEFIQALNIKVLDVHDVRRLGIRQAMRSACNHLDSCEKVHVSFDIDAIDPTYASATGTPVTDGFTDKEALYIATALHEELGDTLVGMDMVEVNPDLPGAQQTVDLAARIIKKFVGI